MNDECGGSCGHMPEIYRLRSLVIRSREMVLASAHHLFLGATVCSSAGFPESARQMTELIDRLRLLADQLDAAGQPTIRD